MTTHDDLDRTSPEFDRLMTAWFDAEARVHEPDDLLDRTISRTARTRPRPAWLLSERWIPMELTMRRVRSPRFTRYAVILAVLILVTTLAIAVAVIGSQRRVPAPFGPARNGSIFLATNGGDIVGIDATTSSSTLLVSGVDANAHPATSLRGSHVAFVRTDAAGHHVDVVDTDRGAAIRISLVPLDSIPHDFAWSPDDRQLAWISGNDLWMAHTDGSESHRIDVGMTVSDIAWRPPAGAEVVIRAAAANGLAGLYLMRSDGSNLRPITAIDGGEYGYTETDLVARWHQAGVQQCAARHRPRPDDRWTPRRDHPAACRGERDPVSKVVAGRNTFGAGGLAQGGRRTGGHRQRRGPPRSMGRYRPIVRRRAGLRLVTRWDADPGRRLE